MTVVETLKGERHLARIRTRFSNAYFKTPERYDAFARAQDPEDRIARRLTNLAEDHFSPRRFAQADVLDLACGTGRHCIPVAPPLGHYIGIDPSRRSLDLARISAAGSQGSVEFREGTAANIPLPDSSVDFAFSCWGDFEVWDSWPELKRVVRPDGLIAFVGNWGAEDAFHQYWPHSALQLWETRKAWLTKHGFAITRVSTNIALHDSEIRKHFAHLLCQTLSVMRNVPNEIDLELYIAHRAVSPAVYVTGVVLHDDTLPDWRKVVAVAKSRGIRLLTSPLVPPAATAVAHETMAKMVSADAVVWLANLEMTPIVRMELDIAQTLSKPVLCLRRNVTRRSAQLRRELELRLMFAQVEFTDDDLGEKIDKLMTCVESLQCVPPTEDELDSDFRYNGISVYYDRKAMRRFDTREIIRVVAVQLSVAIDPDTLLPKDETAIEADVRDALEQVNKLGARCDVVVLPELCGVSSVADLAQTYVPNGLAVLGSRIVDRARRRVNCVRIFDQGTEVAVAEKAHLTDMQHGLAAQELVRSGVGPSVLIGRFGAIGVCICNDYRLYHERLARVCDVVLVPSFNKGTEHFARMAHLQVLLTHSFAVLVNVAEFGRTAVFGNVRHELLSQFEARGLRDSTSEPTEIVRLKAGKVGMIACDFNLESRAVVPTPLEGGSPAVSRVEVWQRTDRGKWNSLLPEAQS